MRRLSGRHWSPLHVIVRGVRWLAEAGARSVLDVGSGAGKFCVVGALSSSLSFVGVERRGRLISSSRALARAFGVQGRVRFIEGEFGTADLPRTDAYYFYNPFGENLSERDAQIDHDVPLDGHRYLHDLALARAFLTSLPVGALVLTYHGFGEQMPRTFDEARAPGGASGLLRLYRQSERRRTVCAI